MPINNYRSQKWKLVSEVRGDHITLHQELPVGSHLAWKKWKALNRLQAGAGRWGGGRTLHNWGQIANKACTLCAEDLAQIFECPRPFFHLSFTCGIFHLWYLSFTIFHLWYNKAIASEVCENESSESEVLLVEWTGRRINRL